MLQDSGIARHLKLTFGTYPLVELFPNRDAIIGVDILSVPHTLQRTDLAPSSHMWLALFDVGNSVPRNWAEPFFGRHHPRKSTAVGIDFLSHVHDAKGRGSGRKPSADHHHRILFHQARSAGRHSTKRIQTEILDADARLGSDVP
jgi:hypothetical protein